ncbi:MAG TPA: preprotein translocase subunit SecE [Longilinea sp.]|nr:preprotein translocase subunit SecE [Longilinea sp.]
MAEKDKKDTKEKKPNKIVRWWNETVGELRKVTWPTPKEAWRMTKIVLVVVIFVAILLGGLDWAFTQLVGLIVG